MMTKQIWNWLQKEATLYVWKWLILVKMRFCKIWFYRSFMIENILTLSSESDGHYGFKLCWLRGSLHTLLGHYALNTS